MTIEFSGKQFLLFLLTGGTAALVNFFTRIIYDIWLSFSAAVIVAYFTGMVTAFFLARLFVFTRSQQSVQHSAFWFCIVNLLAILQTWLISLALAFHLLPALEITHYVPEISHAIGVTAPVFSSYIGHKYLSFK